MLEHVLYGALAGGLYALLGYLRNRLSLQLPMADVYLEKIAAKTGRSSQDVRNAVELVVDELYDEAAEQKYFNPRLFIMTVFFGALVGGVAGLTGLSFSSAAQIVFDLGLLTMVRRLAALWS
ncbi:MAG: hypothetical protein QXF97_06495 [Candidatus Caldarchaeum sp.]